MSFLRAHPYFRDVDRTTAHLLVLYSTPIILRPSSIEDKYAITYKRKHSMDVLHHLLRVHDHGPVDVMDETGKVYYHAISFDALLARILSDAEVSAEAAAQTPDPSDDGAGGT